MSNCSKARNLNVDPLPFVFSSTSSGSNVDPDPLSPPLHPWIDDENLFPHTHHRHHHHPHQHHPQPLFRQRVAEYSANLLFSEYLHMVSMSKNRHTSATQPSGPPNYSELASRGRGGHRSHSSATATATATATAAAAAVAKDRIAYPSQTHTAKAVPVQGFPTPKGILSKAFVHLVCLPTGAVHDLRRVVCVMCVTVQLASAAVYKLCFLFVPLWIQAVHHEWIHGRQARATCAFVLGLLGLKALESYVHATAKKALLSKASQVAKSVDERATPISPLLQEELPLESAAVSAPTLRYPAGMDPDPSGVLAAREALAAAGHPLGPPPPPSEANFGSTALEEPSTMTAAAAATPVKTTVVHPPASLVQSPSLKSRVASHRSDANPTTVSSSGSNPNPTPLTPLRSLNRNTSTGDSATVAVTMAGSGSRMNSMNGMTHDIHNNNNVNDNNNISHYNISSSSGVPSVAASHQVPPTPPQSSSALAAVEAQIRRIKEMIIEYEAVMYGNELTVGDIPRDQLGARVSNLCRDVGIEMNTSSGPSYALFEDTLRQVGVAVGVLSKTS